jgi:D-alanyl-D-alanine dipeptidase
MTLHPKLSLIVVAFYVSGLTSCGQQQAEHSMSQNLPVNKENYTQNLLKRNINLDKVMARFGLSDVTQMDSTIWFELKYYGSDNFMRQKLYHSINRPYLQKDVALRLMKCSSYLRSKDTSLHLLIYDAVRPIEVQQKMWSAMDTIPVGERIKFISNPKNKSLHNYGAAVDLTICRSNRKPLDMGAGFDDIRLIAYPSYEAHFLETGELSKEQYKNRQLLRTVMRSQKFRNIPSEWWHFNACPRWEAKQKYALLEKEPFAN